MVKVVNTRDIGFLFHYGHFISDCLMPEIQNRVYKYKDVYRLMGVRQTIGNFSNMYEEIMGTRNIELSEKEFSELEYPKIDVIGCNGVYSPRVIKESREFILSRYNPKKDSSYPSVILIERGESVELIDESKYKMKIHKDALKNGKDRRCINDIDLLKGYLDDKKVDYKTIFLEKMPFEEQLNYFYNANLVIACHGASLCNLLFCQEQTKVIEVMPSVVGEKIQRFSINWYKNLSESANLDYYSSKNKIGKIINLFDGLQSISNRF